MKQFGSVEQLVFGLFILYIIYIFWSGSSKKPRKRTTTTTVVHRRYYSNHSSDQRLLNKPPGALSLFIASISIFILIIITITCLSQWADAVQDYEKQRGIERGGSWDTEIANFIFSDADMGITVGDNIPTVISPNGSVFWITYMLSCILMIAGIRFASNRRSTHKKNLLNSEKKLRPILRRLAMDPNGVIKGRIRLPEAVPISKPSKNL